MRAQKRCHGKDVENNASKLQKVDHSLDTTMEAEAKNDATAIHDGVSLDTMVRLELNKSDEVICAVAETVMTHLSEIFARGNRNLLLKWTADLNEVMKSIRTTLVSIRNEDFEKHGQATRTTAPPGETIHVERKQGSE